METSKRIKVVAYCRVSTESQADEGVSLAAQAAKCRAYCDVFDLDLVEVIEDAGLSGKTLDRPGLERALAMLREGHVGGIVVVALSRLTRSVRDLGFLVEEYFASGRSALFSVGENVESRSAAGRLVLNVLMSVAQWEREACAERTRDALAHLRASGVTLGATGLGWTRTEELDDEGRRRVVELPDERATVERIRALRAEGRTLREIVAQLDEEHRPTKRGGRWAPATVAGILSRCA